MATAICVYLAVATLSLIALWSPPFYGRGVIFALIISILLYLAEQQSFPTDPSTRYCRAMLWSICLNVVSNILFTIPEKTYWRMGHPREATYMRGFGWKKLRWAATLMANMRGVGWNFQVKGVPNGRKNESRRHFIFRQAMDLMMGSVILMFCSAYIGTRHHRYAPLPPTITLQERILMVFAIGIQSCFANSLNYQGLSLLAVASGLDEPEVRLQLV